MNKEEVAVIIPARIGSTRLPRKLLKKIGDKTIIEHVASKVAAANVGDVFVATDSDEIAGIVSKTGYTAIMTDESCSTGSDRVYQALMQINKNNDFKYVINVQGDMPFVDGNVIKHLVDKLQEGNSDIVTPYVKIAKEEAELPENVKIVKDNNGRALYFSRCPIPYNAEEYLYHVGIYGFTTKALEKFVGLDKGKYEQCESLEQLRALENGMSIGLVESDQIPISIDTESDLEKAREYYSKQSNKPL